LPDGLYELHRYFADVFEDRNAARIVGERYLGAHPDEADRAVLLSKLSLPPTPGDRQSLRLHFEKCRYADFEDLNIVLVDGWIMARTEARTCALITLL
jgi:hypothetical protein